MASHALSEIDPYFVQSLSGLYQTDHLVSHEPSLLQRRLEEAIFNKYGIKKDFSHMIASMIQRPVEDVKVIEESKTTSSSDNELELDLFNEDLSCVVCNQMDVGARNQLLECSQCHSLYHQECHFPAVTQLEAEKPWACQNCVNNKKSSITPGSSPGRAPSPSVSKVSTTKPSPPYSGSTKSASSKQANTSKHSSSSSKSTSSHKPVVKTSSASSSSISSKSSVTPNINIISADKRLQIMKKKAAKLHEKRKQMPR